MSNTDSFIDEVTEEVRRDRLFAALRRYGWVGIAVVLLTVGGTAYVEWRKSATAATSAAFGDALSAALQATTPEDRAKALAAVPAEGGARVALRQFLTAASALESGDTAGALAALDAIAADGTLPDSYRQLAMFKRVLAAAADMPAADRAATLDVLAAPGAPYRMLALEQQALDLVAAGDGAGAVDRLRALLQEPGVTSGLRRRATQLMVALGADPAAG